MLRCSICPSPAGRPRDRGALPPTRRAAVQSALKKAAKAFKTNDSEASLDGNADLLVQACIGVYGVFSGATYTLDPTNPDKWIPFDPDDPSATWVRFDETLAKALGVGYQEIASTNDAEPGIRGALEMDGPVLTRVITQYGKRPIRWMDAVKKRYQKELTMEQKVRFAARLGVRAMGSNRRND